MSIKARKLSYDSQVYLLMLDQFLHVFSLNELVDISKIHAKELSRILGSSPANRHRGSGENQYSETDFPVAPKRF